jgi:hypothetical protein
MAMLKVVATGLSGFASRIAETSCSPALLSKCCKRWHNMAYDLTGKTPGRSKPTTLNYERKMYEISKSYGRERCLETLAVG